MMHITNMISQVFGKFAEKEFSKPIQKIINWSYVKFLKLDMSEFLSPSEYKSLNALFTRELQKSRLMPKVGRYFVSPADSMITQFGEIQRSSALQIKGMDYKIGELLSQEVDIKKIGKLEGGKYINFYLSPRDYHHYHMPFDGQVLRAIYIPGKIYPVNLTYLHKKINLFIENERVILECQTSNNKLFYMILVGALNVGKMVVKFEPKIETNKGENSAVFKYDSLHFKQGIDLGYFKMGSTVVILAEKGLIEPQVSIFQHVKFGTIIAKANE